MLVQEGTTSNLGCFQKRCHALIGKKKNTPQDPLAANRLETGYKHRDDCAKYFLVEKSTGVVQWADPPVLSWQRGSEYGILEMKNRNTEFEDRYQGEQYKREAAIHLFLRQVLLCSACQCSCWHLMEQYEVFQQQWYIASSSQL